MQIKSTGINWTQDKIIHKYKVLKKVKENLAFECLYYPYWVLKVRTQISGILFGSRILKELNIVDGITGKTSRIINEPDVNNCDNDKSCEVVVPFIIEEKAGIEATKNQFIKYYAKKFNHPLRPRVNVEIVQIETIKVYKPYWIIHNGQDLSLKKMMVVDGTTGLVGMPESKNVIKAWLSQKNRRHS